jgi:hypothetical protein
VLWLSIGLGLGLVTACVGERHPDDLAVVHLDLAVEHAQQRHVDDPCANRRRIQSEISFDSIPPIPCSLSSLSRLLMES